MSGDVTVTAVDETASPHRATTSAVLKPLGSNDAHAIAINTATTTASAHDSPTGEQTAVSTPTTDTPVASKRRAVSFQDRLPLRASASSTVASAFATVSTATTERLAKFRSRSSERSVASSTATGTATSASQRSTSPVGRPMVTRSSSWRASVSDFARRAKAAAKRTARPSYSWQVDLHTPAYATSRFAYHNEDAGAASAYYHIVADGVSAPFSRTSMIESTVTSALLATQLVAAVAQTLDDLTASNAIAIDDATTFEAAVLNAIQATRIALFQYRHLRLATTLVVVYFDRWHGIVRTFTLGDSKFLIVRHGVVVYETPAVVREFNVPTVVSVHTPVAATDYVIERFHLQQCDVCLTFSDGLGDNLYVDDILEAIGCLKEPVCHTQLQDVCDALVHASQMTISVEQARVEAKRDLQKRQLFPFATAAARAYRARAVLECTSEETGSFDARVADHVAHSAALVELHAAKRVLEKQHVVVRLRNPPRPTVKKHHYSLEQLKRMAEMHTKKPDDITLFMTQCR